MKKKPKKKQSLQIQPQLLDPEKNRKIRKQLFSDFPVVGGESKRQSRKVRGDTNCPTQREYSRFPFCSESQERIYGGLRSLPPKPNIKNLIHICTACTKLFSEKNLQKSGAQARSGILSLNPGSAPQSTHGLETSPWIPRQHVRQDESQRRIHGGGIQGP